MTRDDDHNTRVLGSVLHTDLLGEDGTTIYVVSHSQTTISGTDGSNARA